MPGGDTDVTSVLAGGDPDQLAALVKAGADLRYKREHGYDALMDAVHGRDVARDPRLLDLLRLLIASGVDLGGVTSYRESGLRVLSRLGRFDAVQLLLEAGADEKLLGWTPLIKAVALGSRAEVEACISGGAPLEETDWWSRTAWLVALLAGDLGKAQALLAAGANVNARGRGGTTPLSYAIAGHHPDVVRWLLELGQGVDETNDFGSTPLMLAVEDDDLDCVEILLKAGADIDRETNAGSAIQQVQSREIAKRLLDAGADPVDLSYEGRRALLGFRPEPDQQLVDCAPEDFLSGHTRYFGNANPERMQELFWANMVRSGVTGYEGARRFQDPVSFGGRPIWCAQRFGQSLTFLPGGRIIQIGGEHEDFYDPDFCIYNDVFVHESDGSFAILGYPEEVFPPTDFHTATLIDDSIYIIGSLGYKGSRRYGETPVYRLNVGSFRIERLKTSGAAPGWIYRHRAVQTAPNEIEVSLGKIVTDGGEREIYTENRDSFVLNLDHMVWRRNDAKNEGPG